MLLAVNETCAPAFRKQVSLVRGSGARRLGLAKCRATIQLLLVQASGEVWAAHGHRLQASAVKQLLDVLQSIGAHARAVNADGDLRRELALAQMRDQVTPCNPPSSCSQSLRISHQ